MTGTLARDKPANRADTADRATPRRNPLPARAPVERCAAQARARIGRLRRWEFWPRWTVYLPLTPCILRSALRARRLTACTAVNPAIPLGGFVGESKWRILSLLPREHTIPTAVIEPGEPQTRLETIEAFIRSRDARWPLVLKPDVGERGRGVRLVRGPGAALEYLRRHREPVLAQAYHPGPYELGVFYVRRPGRRTGRLFSITEKRLPTVTGDGASTIADLVRRHPRLSLQTRAVLRNIGDQAAEIPAAGETAHLGISGNHCRGAMFLDGRRFATRALRRTFDRIIDDTPGVHFGRFDIRFADPDELRTGRGFSIIELNGLLSEPTHIYDPAYRYRHGQRILRAHWRLAYEIGSANIRAGATPARLREVVAAVLAHPLRRGRD